MEMDEYFPLGQDEAVTDEDEFATDDDDEEEDDEDDYAVESVRRAYFGGGRTVDFPAPSSSAFNGTNHQPHHEISLAASSSASSSPSLRHKVVPAAFPIKKRKRRSACHSWTSESRAAEIVRQFAPDRTSAIFYLFRRIAGGGMNKNLRIVPAKRNPPKYSCFFEELGMVSDPDNDSHYHVWAFPPTNSAASRFMATYVGATELEGVELGGATSDEEDANSAAAGTVAKEKPKRGRKRSKENNGEQGLSGKAKKEARVGDEEGQRRRQGDTTSTDDTSEIELEMEYDEAAYGYYRVGETVADRARPAQRPGDSTRVKGGTTGNTMTPPILLVSEAQQNGGRAYHEQQSQQLPAIHDDHLAHLYSDLAAAEHLSLDEVLEHPALFGPDGVGASGTLSSPNFGNPSELMHTFLLQELDLDSINVDFRKRLTGRSEDSTDSRAWSVYEGVWQGLNDVAVKIYHEERAYQTECHNLWKFNHPNVLRAYGRLYAIPGRDIQGCVVLEKANLGDLHSWMIDNRRYLHDTQFISHFLDIVKGVAAGMHYIHSSSPALIHGELKPSNILLFGHTFDLHGTPHYLGLRAKITDVGISHDLANDSAARGRGTTENDTARTLWQPPEQRSSHAAAYYALGTDVLPFGLILWSFWSKVVSVEQLRRVLPLSGAERPPIPKECPTQWASLIERCWAHDTRERISFKALLEELGKIQP